MLEDLFGEDDQQDFLGSTLPPQRRKARNCAEFLDYPTFKREDVNLVGLKNQGATCYLNSLIQALYMTPELRKVILQLPLCEGDDINKPTNFVNPSSSKYRILFALQKLFSELQELDAYSLSTEQVTASFGWQDNEQLMQQDIQEAFRVIFDVLERSLSDTVYNGMISSYFKGITVSYTKCLECNRRSEREEPFFDLIMQVKHIKDVQESFLNLISVETLNDKNQYFCEICNKKVDAHRGITIKKLPKILTLSLSRFEYDWETLQRKKVNDEFQFGLELNVAPFVEEPELLSENENIYELFSIIVHMGSAHGGHYHTYIRDTLNEGKWEEQMNLKKLQDALQKEKEKEQEQQRENEQQNNEKQTTQEEEQTEQINNQEIVEEGKKGKKKSKQVKVQQNEEKAEKREKNEKQRRFNPGNFDEIEYPLYFENDELRRNWFDFNDSTVTAIPYNRIQGQFGGSSENAYILIYRQKAISKENQKKPEIQGYMKKSILEQNQKFENEREIYEDAKKHIEIINYHYCCIDIQKYTLIQDFDPEQAGNKLKINLKIKLKEYIQQINNDKDNHNNHCVLVEVVDMKNGHIKFQRELSYTHYEQTFDELEIFHMSTWILLNLDNEEDKQFYGSIKQFIGEEAVPIRVNVRLGNDTEYKLILHHNSLVSELRTQIQEYTHIPIPKQLIQILEDVKHKFITPDSFFDTKTLRELRIDDNAELLVQEVTDFRQYQIQNEETEQTEQTEQQQQQVPQTQEQLPDNIRTIIADCDEQDDVLKYYVKLEWTVQELFNRLLEKFGIQDDKPRRLRRLKEKDLFYQEQYQNTLVELGFDEGGIRIRLERGAIPNFGNINIRIKNQSKIQDTQKPSDVDIVMSLNEKISTLKNTACELMGLDPLNHRLYKTDWLEEPTQHISKENLSLIESDINANSLLIIRDNENLLQKEVINIDIYLTESGNPQEAEIIGVVVVKQEDTLDQLKLGIIQLPRFSENQKINLEQIRIREYKKDGQYGQIMRPSTKTLKKLGVDSFHGIVCQILQENENLKNNEIQIYLRKRNIQTKNYEQFQEFFLDVANPLTILNLKTLIISYLQLRVNTNDIDIAVYRSYEFRWQEINAQTIEELKKKGKKGQKKSNKSNNNTTEIKEDVIQSFLIKEGDIIGYRLVSENVDNQDDFQTLEDEEHRKLAKAEKLKKQAEINAKQTKYDNASFQIYTDF